jgi:hypothetical protein
VQPDPRVCRLAGIPNKRGALFHHRPRVIRRQRCDDSDFFVEDTPTAVLVRQVLGRR